MFDSDTMVVSYDESRGEPRGARRRGGEQESGKGDCVDCGLCVQVCPVGIDIREGLQYECISCGLCIDACDAIMDKVGSAPKLISFTTENRLQNKQTRLLRPRLLGYGAGLMVMTSLFLYALATRIPVELDVVRDRALLYRETSRGLIENIYTLRISNMDNRNHEFLIDAEGDYQFRFVGQGKIFVLAGEVVTHVVRLELDPGFLRAGNTDVNFVIAAGDDETIRDTETSRFIGPFLR